MKGLIIAVVVTGVVGGIVLYQPNTSEYVRESSEEEITAVPEVVEVDVIEKRIADAQAEAMAEIETKANEMRDQFIQNELKTVEAEVLAEIESEIKARRVDVEKETGAYWRDTENVKAYIRQTFPENPALFIRIAYGESGMKQWYADGRVVRGIIDNDDTGLFQINNRYWKKEAQRLGLDYENSIEDNIKMARHVFDTQGVTAWVYYNDHIAMR